MSISRSGPGSSPVRDLYPSREAPDAGSGSTDAMPEALDQLDELLVTLVRTQGGS